MGTFLGISLPGPLAPASDVIILLFLGNFGYMLWLLGKRKERREAAYAETLSADWSKEVEAAWDEGEDGVPSGAPDASAFGEDEEGEAPFEPTTDTLPPRAKCAACNRRLVEKDIWAKCLGCGTHYHTLCLGRAGECDGCGNPLEGLASEEEDSKTEVEGDEA